MSRSNGAMAMATVLASLLGHSINTTEALRVTAPSEGMTVVAERPYIVSWTGANADDRFEIDLHYGGSYSFGFEDDADCGFWLANVCSAGDDACMQQEDMSSQVTLPQPIKGYSNNGYRIRISEVGAEKARCSDDFYLMATADVPAVGEAGGPTMAVISPDEGSLAEAGGTYTVEFDYDNGFGERVGRFRIDLYKAQDGAGDCGLWVTSICDKPERGCHDSQGDYDVTIPRNTAEGMYSIRVGLFGDDSIFACSAPFEIAPAGEGGEELWGGSYSY